jgi:hypothetical protein
MLVGFCHKQATRVCGSICLIGIICLAPASLFLYCSSGHIGLTLLDRAQEPGICQKAGIQTGIDFIQLESRSAIPVLMIAEDQNRESNQPRSVEEEQN